MLRHAEFFAGNGIREHFFAGEASPAESFKEEAEALLAEYISIAARHGCSLESEMLLRFHLSDITNQAPFLKELLNGKSSFISIVGQPPANGGRIALEAWHWCGGKLKQMQEGMLEIVLKNYKVLWFKTPDPAVADSAKQTAYEFETLKRGLSVHNATVEANTVRTWLYCRDVDNNYAGLVMARNEFFAGNGLSTATHFIASTGIEGQMEKPSRLVKMDSVNYTNLRQGQQIYLSAPEMLSPTALYGVSFERGTRLVLGDRSHYFISGTASIDSRGQVVHPYDVTKQTERLVDNVAALMESSAGTLSDLKWATVYLRDPADASPVRSVLARRLPPELPLVVVRAPVCRPAWLVEMECVAVNSQGNPAFAPLS